MAYQDPHFTKAVVVVVVAARDFSLILASCPLDLFPLRSAALCFLCLEILPIFSLKNLWENRRRSSKWATWGEKIRRFQGGENWNNLKNDVIIESV